jgi:hypothetical protein
MNDDQHNAPGERSAYELETEPIATSDPGATQDLPPTAPPSTGHASEVGEASGTGDPAANQPSQFKNLAIAGAVGIAIVFAGAGFGAGYWAGDSGSAEHVPAVNQMDDGQGSGQTGENPLREGELGESGDGQFGGPMDGRMGVPPGGQVPDGQQPPGQGSDGTDSPQDGDTSGSAGESGDSQPT